MKFTADYYWVQPAFTIAYKAGMHLNVTRTCADEAVAAGKAVRTKKVADGKEAE
ncbi:hypothetical protein MUO32_05165 [Shinella sp. CPCC 101442]|uniref:hypothetical protein n=1 Tax=Shinella sp. CPCC 101442 TaxID=2932265 RepID=UPI00215275A6|nr:hypothetical protein [Shinella sp. CPCC 101442]MCR6498417.1 hypothetical protein [Shinella sp. CPCC 101442]